MVKIGVLNHSDGSGFQSYVAIKLSKEELNEQTDNEKIACNDHFISEADENLYTSYKTHFIPIKITRLLYIKKIDVNSIEKHAFNNSIDVIVNCSPAPVSPKFNTMLSKSESNSSQSLCSNLTEVLLNTCEHSLITKCTICSENAELKKKQEEGDENVMVNNDLPPIEMFSKSKTNEEKGKNDVSSWVDQTAHLTEEQRIAKQKYDELEARVALAKDNWNEVPIDYTPGPKEMEIFNSKLDKAFNELITVRTNISRRLLPVELNDNVVYNSFEALKQKAERRFEMLHKGIHIPEGFDFDAIPSCPRIYDEPISEETDDVSNPKFFTQNKNIKFFKSNQNSFSNQRRMRQPGQQNNVYFC